MTFRYRMVDGVLTPWEDDGPEHPREFCVADLPECWRCGGACGPHQCMEGMKKRRRNG